MTLLPIRLLSTALFCWLLAACSSAPKTTPELSRMHGKKVALVGIEGEPLQKSIIQVALINQLTRRGTFEIMSQQDVNAAKDRPDIPANDPHAVARQAGADYAMKMKVLRFEGTLRDGYSRTEKAEFDPLLAEEQGKDKAKVQKLYKVKSLTGDVAVQIDFTHLASNDTRSAVAEKTGTITDGSEKSAARLPPVMGYLQKLMEEAFEAFFEKY